MPLGIKILIGFLIGLVCGVAPLVFGILTKHKYLGIIGISVTSLFGLLFSVLDKSPFNEIIVAIVFLLFNFASNKKRQKKNDEEDEDDDES